MKTLIFITVLFFLNGCSFHQEKCIEIVDENQRLLSAYSSMYVLTSFQYLTEIMNDTPPPITFYGGKLIAESSGSTLCFSSPYDILALGEWYRINFNPLIYKETRIYYKNFDSIPSKIVLHKREQNTSQESNFKLNIPNTFLKLENVTSISPQRPIAQ